jgi:hypothetical protein
VIKTKFFLLFIRKIGEIGAISVIGVIGWGITLIAPITPILQKKGATLRQHLILISDSPPVRIA